MIASVHSATSAFVGGGALAEMAAQPFGAELDRRQRILDFVREPPRHVAPGRDALRPNQRRHVVEHEHRALATRRVSAGEHGGRGRQVDFAVLARERDLLHRPRRRSRPRGFDQRQQRLQVLAAEHVARPARPSAVVPEAEQPLGRAVDRRDAPVGVERDDAGRDALEDRLDVAAARVDFEVLPLEILPRLLELLAARPQLGRHHVERLDERAELVAGLRLEPDVELAGADRARAFGQHLHRPRDALREIQAQPGRAHQNQQRDREKDRLVDAAESAACSTRRPW